MTPNQQRAKEEYEKAMAQLVDARTAAHQLSQVKTVEDMLSSFRLLGTAAYQFLDITIKEMTASYKKAGGQ